MGTVDAAPVLPIGLTLEIDGVKGSAETRLVGDVKGERGWASVFSEVDAINAPEGNSGLRR